MAARSAETVRFFSAASLAMRSFSRRSRSALSSTGAGAGAGSAAGSAGWGAGSSGAAFPPPATAKAAAGKSISREGGRIITPHSWVGGDGGPAEAARPRGKPGRTWGPQLPDSAGFDIDDPDLTTATAIGDERDMPAVWRPGWVFVPAG